METNKTSKSIIIISYFRTLRDSGDTIIFQTQTVEFSELKNDVDAMICGPWVKTLQTHRLTGLLE